jgi:hypothetical protein
MRQHPVTVNASFGKGYKGSPNRIYHKFLCTEKIFVFGKDIISFI